MSRVWKEDGETVSERKGEWKKRACEERWKRIRGPWFFIRDVVSRLVR
jgi:hypothetical protein